MKRFAIAAIVLTLAGTTGTFAQDAGATGAAGAGGGAGAGTGGGLGAGLGLGAGVGASLAVPLAAMAIGVAAVEGGRSENTTTTSTN